MGLTVNDLNKMHVYDYLQHYKNDDGKECIVFPITRAKNVIGIPKVATVVSELKTCSFGLLATSEDSVDASLLNKAIGVSIF